MYTTQLTWFSPPHSPAGGFAPKPSRSPLLPLSLKILYAAGLTSILHRSSASNASQKQNSYTLRQVLLLYCTVLAVPFRTVYVDRFACNWHRLATTDLSCTPNYKLLPHFLQEKGLLSSLIFDKKVIYLLCCIVRTQFYHTLKGNKP